MNPISDEVSGLGVLSGTGTFPGNSPASPVGGAGAPAPSGGPGGADGGIPDFEHGAVGGIHIQRGTVLRGRRPLVPAARPACATAQCPCHVETAYFTMIDITAAPTIATGQSAVYGLLKLDVKKQFGQEVRVLGVHYHLLPADVNGIGLGTPSAAPLAWGDAQGLSAAILVGINLPTQLGAWSSASVYAAGLEVNQATPPTRAVRSDALSAQYICAPIRFPTGTFDQVTPNFNAGTIPLDGDQAPVLAGETLDVALAVNRAFVTGLTGQICGFAQVGIVIGHTLNDRPFRL